MVREDMMSKYITTDDPCLRSFGYVADAFGQYSVSIVCATILSKEAYESLKVGPVISSLGHVL